MGDMADWHLEQMEHWDEMSEADYLDQTCDYPPWPAPRKPWYGPVNPKDDFDPVKPGEGRAFVGPKVSWSVVHEPDEWPSTTPGSMQHVLLLPNAIPVVGHATSADWWDTSRECLEHPERNHPRLIRWIIEHYSREFDVVYDPMAGAGTVMREAERLARVGVGYDIVPEYRWLWPQWALGDNHPLPADLVVTSPDYGGNHSPGNTDRQRDLTRRARSKAGEGLIVVPGSLQESKALDQYLARLSIVYRDSVQKLKPGGYFVTIVRNRIKGGREFDWVALNILVLLSIWELAPVRIHEREIGPSQQWQKRAKLAEQQGKPVPPCVRKEHVLVFRRREDEI